MTKNLSSNDINDVVEKRLRILLEQGAKARMSLEMVKPELPHFYDEEKFRLGQQAFHNNIFSMMIGKLSGLVSLMAIKTILDVIMFTKKSSTPCLAYRRYAMTILHTVVWQKEDPNGKPNKFLESLKIVRKKHCIAFRRSTEANVHKPTHLDMALAQFGFIGYIMISGEYLGLKITAEEMEGVVHVWRVVGNMLGMDDKFNICTGTVQECRLLCRKLLEEVFLPSMAKKNEHFDDMGRVLLQSVWPINFNIEPIAYITFTFHLATLSAINNNHSIKIDTNIPFYSWFMFKFQHFVLKYLMRPSAWWSPIFRALFNSLMRLAIFSISKFSIFAYFKFGKRYAKINIFNHDFVN